MNTQIFLSSRATDDDGEHNHRGKNALCLSLGRGNDTSNTTSSHNLDWLFFFLVLLLKRQNERHWHRFEFILDAFIQIFYTFHFVSSLYCRSNVIIYEQNFNSHSAISFFIRPKMLWIYLFICCSAVCVLEKSTQLRWSINFRWYEHLGALSPQHKWVTVDLIWKRYEYTHIQFVVLNMAVRVFG